MIRSRDRSRGGRSASGSSSFGTLPLYSRVVFWGDGLFSVSASPGSRNVPEMFLWRMNGRVRAAIGWNQCYNGGDMDDIYNGRDYAFDQAPDLLVFTSQGHNDALYSAAYAAQMVKWERNLDAAVSALPDALIVVCTTAQSNVGGESTYWATVNALQLAKVAALQAVHGDRIVLADLFATWDYTTMTHDGVHPNQIGGKAMADVLYAAISPRVTAATKDEILNDVAAKSWRSANLHPDWALSGTSGTKSGTIAPTGNWATGQRITNNLTNGTGVGVTVSKDTTNTPTYEECVAVLAGTPASANTIVMDDTTAFTFGAGSVPGAHYEWRAGLKIDNGAGAPPAGVMTFGSITSSMGSYGSYSSFGGLTADLAYAMDGVITSTSTIFGGSGPTNVNPAIGVRLNAASIAGTTIRYSRPAVFQTEIEPYAPMLYLGSDGKFSSNFKNRLTGTGVNDTTSVITAATAATLRWEPGAWSGGASDWSTVFSRVLKKNGVVVSGAYASGWTFDFTGQVIAGDTITLELTANNGLGSPQTITRTYTVV